MPAKGKPDCAWSADSITQLSDALVVINGKIDAILQQNVSPELATAFDDLAEAVQVVDNKVEDVGRCIDKIKEQQQRKGEA